MSTTEVLTDFPGGYIKPALYAGIINAAIGAFVYKEGLATKQNLMDAGAMALSSAVGNWVSFNYMPATNLGMEDARIFPGLVGAAVYTGFETYRGHGDLGKNAGLGVVSCVGGNMLAIDKTKATEHFKAKDAKKKEPKT